MNNLPNYTSFQGVLDSIIRNYLLNELPPEVGESGIRYQNIAERDLGLSQAAFLRNIQNSETNQNRNVDPVETNNNAGAPPSVPVQNMQNATNEHEYVRALYQCFEKRGVFKELQTFLRHKLVSVLQDEWPDLQHSAVSKVDENALVFQLIQDFLKSHRLLYTLSVLVSEADVKQLHTKVLYGKLSAKEAEDLLDGLGIKRLTRLNTQILKCYFDRENFSLLESMHYLGVWVDDSVGQQLDNEAEIESGIMSRKGRTGTRTSKGESIVLSRSAKTGGKVIMKDATAQCIGTSESSLGVERRLLEMQRRLEREKESKVREEIERYKREEQQRNKDEMEATYQLQLIEKEREHFLNMQKRLDEINVEVQKERQKWLEEKVNQEKKLQEFQKELCKTKKEAIGNLKVGFNETVQTQANLSLKSNLDMPGVSSADTSPNVVQCSCGCTCKQKSTSRPQNKNFERKSVTMRERESYDTFTGYRAPPPLDAIQQDQLVFLQYKLEQQDEEIKSLRRQLLLSPRVATEPKMKLKVAGGGDATKYENISGRVEKERDRTADELGNFLNEAKTRVGKLDVAVSKVDEIVQEVLARKREREVTPISSEISARIQASAEHNRRLKRSLFTTTNSLYSSVPMQSGALVHQQLPEKQVKFVSSQLIKPLNNFDMHQYEQTMTATEMGAGAASLFNEIPSTVQSFHRTKELMMERPTTPVDKIFPVAYGEPRVFPGTSSTHHDLQSKSENIDKKATKSLIVDQVKQKKNRGQKEMSQSSETSTPKDTGESLFHMAAKQMLSEKSEHDKNENLNKNNLEEKAVKHGALFREKVTSPNECDDEDCKSVSVAESISIRNTKTALAKSNRNNVHNNTNHPVKALRTKSDMSSGSTSDSISTGKNGRQSKAKEQQSVKHKSSPTPSSSHGSIGAVSERKHGKVFALELNKSNPSAMEETDLDENDFSNISAPKSEDIEDFWQI